jgi:hypothetical protein
MISPQAWRSRLKTGLATFRPGLQYATNDTRPRDATSVGKAGEKRATRLFHLLWQLEPAASTQ